MEAIDPVVNKDPEFEDFLELSTADLKEIQKFKSSKAYILLKAIIKREVQDVNAVDFASTPSGNARFDAYEHGLRKGKIIGMGLLDEVLTDIKEELEIRKKKEEKEI